MTYCQSGQIVGHITKKGDASLERNYLTVLLTQGDSTIKGTMADKSGFFKFDNVSNGVYSLKIRQIGYRDFVTDNLKIVKDSILRLNLTYPPPCNFVYEKGRKPMCIGGHTDNIIPIVYGLPTKKTMDKAKKGLLHLGGCVVSDCDPHYYCTTHKIEL